MNTDALFEALAARRRRYVLYHLAETDGNVSVRALAGTIAAAEAGRPALSIPAERRRRVAADLARCHLPVLDARGFVEYDRERDAVALAAGYERASPYLDVASRYERPPTRDRAREG